MSILPGKLGPIDGGRLRGGILSAASSLPAGAQWRQGVTFSSACVDMSDPRLRYCVNPEDATDKPSDAVGEPIVFEPFLVFSQRDCSTWMEPSELEELARIGLDRTLSQSVALQLQTNVLSADGQSSPSLNSEAVVVPGDADIVNTISALLSAAVCECGLTEIVIHAPLRSLPFFIERQLVEWDESRGVWSMGPHTMSFDCYSEIGPGEVQTEEDGSEIWIYVTGPVEWAIGPADVVGRPDSIIVRTNEALSLIEHLAIVRFDTCCVRAAKAVIF